MKGGWLVTLAKAEGWAMSTHGAGAILVFLCMALPGPCDAGPLAGAWESTRKLDDETISYRLTLTERDSHVAGFWTVEGRSVAMGCIRGEAKREVAVVASCTLDGSVGARDSTSICPDYTGNDTRFVRSGPKLLWQTKAAKTARWQTFTVMHGAGTTVAEQPVACANTVGRSR